MELLQFRYFLEAARYENLTRAADELHIAQPALSQSIMRLENELGAVSYTHLDVYKRQAQDDDRDADMPGLRSG